MGIYYELGRLPLCISSNIQFIKYWYRITKCSEEEPLLYAAYKHNLNVNSAWLQGVKKGLKIGGFSFEKEPKYYRGTIIKSITKSCREEFVRGLRDELYDDRRKKEGGNKLRSYHLYKSHFGMSRYLFECKNIADRKNLCRLRLSSHKLHIETGRFVVGEKRLKPDERICKFCPLNECEDELHFITKCTLYKNERENLYTKMKCEHKNFNDINDKAKFYILMSSENKSIINALGRYITSCFEKRANTVL